MDRYKILGRENLDGTSSPASEVLYKVPLPTDFKDPVMTGPRTDATVLYTIISSIVVSHQGGAGGTFSIAVRENDSSGPAAIDYIFKGTTIAANNTMIISPGVTLPAVPQGATSLDGADIYVTADTGNITFHAYGVEVTQ
jgi:hypothetical protein